jgi:hypothetical protein
VSKEITKQKEVPITKMFGISGPWRPFEELVDEFEGEYREGDMGNKTMGQVVEVPPRQEGEKQLTEGPEFGVRAFSLRELKSFKLERPAEIVENILYEGETVALVARPKTGKTRLMQQLSVAVALGRKAEFLGQHVQKRKKVLYVDLESHPSDAIGRFQKIAGEHWPEVQDWVHVYCVPTLGDSTVGLDLKGLEKLKDLVRESRAELLVIDTWRLVFQGKENEAEAVVKNLKVLDQVRLANPKLAIVILHHLRKGNSENIGCSLAGDPQAWLEQASGSLAFIAHTDAAFGFEPEATGGGDRYIFNGARRNGPAPLLILTSDEESLRFELIDDLELRAQQALTAGQYDLWCKLPPAFNWAEAEEIAGGARGKSLLSGTIKRARENRLLDQTQRGQYVKLQRREAHEISELERVT